MAASSPSQTPALASAMRGAARFDRSMVSVRAGLLAAIPVMAVLAGGTAAGDPVAGASMGAGAMLVSEGLRLRVQLVAIHKLIGQRSARVGGVQEAIGTNADHALDLTAEALTRAAAAIEGDQPAAENAAGSARALTEVISEPVSASLKPDPLGTALDRRFAALAGQIRAVAALASAAAQGGTLRARRPYGRLDAPRPEMRDYFEQIRANANLQSPVGRHALRLAIVVSRPPPCSPASSRWPGVTGWSSPPPRFCAPSSAPPSLGEPSGLWARASASAWPGRSRSSCIPPGA